MAHVQLSHQLQRHIRHYFNTSWGPPPSELALPGPHCGWLAGTVVVAL